MEFEMKEYDFVYSARMQEAESNSSFTFTSICRRCREGLHIFFIQ